MQTLTLTQPDDWHLHVREGSLMALVIRHTATVFARAMIMPNLARPITTVKQALAYRDKILKQLPIETGFQPFMTLYLTPHTTRLEIEAARESGVILAIKLYPAGATTLSDAGVSSIGQCRDVFETMQRLDIPLSIHGELPEPGIDIFDREKAFIDAILTPLIADYPEMRIVFEHLTTREAVDFVAESHHRIAGTITAHHLLLNRNDLLAGGIKPHNYCLPVVKKEPDRQALLAAATSGNPKYFLGTDSAPHPRSAKESAVGRAGVYTARHALPLYARAFDSIGKLDRLEAFASKYGAAFYGLPFNRKKTYLVRREQKIPESFSYQDDQLVPFLAGESLEWQVFPDDPEK